MAYKPFGEQIDLTKLGKSITNRGYTGHEHIKGTDFIHMNARLYDPIIGRFLSADTVIQAPFDSQSFNRYSYVRNNPLKYIDPTGHFWGIGGRIKREYRRFEGRVSDHADEIIGVGLIIGGGIMVGTGWGAPYGLGLMGTGAGLIKGEYHIFNGEDGNINVGYNVTYPTTWGQGSGGLTAHQQNTIARGRALDERDRMRSNTYPTIGGSGVDYVHGRNYNPSDDAYVGHVSISYMPRSESVLSQVLSIDATSLAYTAFTYTNIGGIYDTISQYQDGEIGGVEASLMLGASVFLGGAGSKAAKYGFSSFREARKLYKEWGVGSFDTVGDNIRYHTQYRGNGNYAKYMRQASNFNKRGSKKTYLDDGAIRYNRPNGEFLIQRDGFTVTYGVNR